MVAGQRFADQLTADPDWVSGMQRFQIWDSGNSQVVNWMNSSLSLSPAGPFAANSSRLISVSSWACAAASGLQHTVPANRFAGPAQ